MVCPRLGSVRISCARCVALGALLALASLAGCAVRQDASGVSRVGIGLWGFGDPPGVNWNLDWPRRDPPELPPARRPELPPLPPATAARPESAMDDNRICDHRCIPAPPPVVP